VHTLRDLDDAVGLRDALRGARSLLVLGAGFVGAEVASAARGLGLDVTVLEALPLPLTRVFGEAGGALCARLLTEAGVELRCGTPVAGFTDSQTVRLADGSTCSADVVLVALGGTPRLPWLQDSADGLRCGASGRVLGASQVWAVGDVAAWECARCGGHHRTEHWTSAVDQASVVAHDMLGLPSPQATLPYFWSDQFGLKIQLIGRPGAGHPAEALHGSGPDGGPVKGTVLGYFDSGRLVTVAAFGAPRPLARYRPLVAAGASRADALALAAEIDAA
jgi:3-phenylpropionate/trans-cinnamate dioxygenase ferredoxin reductase subunit